MPLSKVRDPEKVVIHFKNEILPEGAIPLEEIIDMSKFSSNQIQEYESMEDAAGIFVEDLNPYYSKIKRHFKSKYIYQFSADFGSFSINENLILMDYERYKINKKCLRELFKFISDSLIEGEEIEIYSCWADEELMKRDRKLDMSININSFELETNFELKDKQYIVVKRNGS